MNEQIKKGKNTATVAYLTLVGTLIAWSMNQEDKNEFAIFHIRQALGLNLLFILLGILLSGISEIALQNGIDILFIITPFWLFFIVLWGFGFIAAIQGNLTYLPIFGNLFQKWFKRLIK